MKRLSWIIWVGPMFPRKGRQEKQSLEDVVLLVLRLELGARDRKCRRRRVCTEKCSHGRPQPRPLSQGLCGGASQEWPQVPQETLNAGTFPGAPSSGVLRSLLPPSMCPRGHQGHTGACVHSSGKHGWSAPVSLLEKCPSFKIMSPR